MKIINFIGDLFGTLAMLVIIIAIMTYVLGDMSGIAYDTDLGFYDADEYSETLASALTNNPEYRDYDYAHLDLLGIYERIMDHCF